MFPLKDDIPTQTIPWVNISLILVNSAVFVYETMLGPRLDPFLLQYGFVPSRFFATGEITPIFSSLFLHGGFFHLIGNMWMLWIFGDNVEDCMGHARYLIFFLLCGICSVLGQGLAGPQSPVPLIGASGAISGVLGAYFLTYPHARVLTLIPIFIIFYAIELPAFLFLGFWFLIQFLQGSASLVAAKGQLQGGIAWWAHICGFAAGVILVFFFRDKQRCRVAQRRAAGIRRLGQRRS
ncbi:MAG: rhomboid family intramembrane serine protease [Desulfobacterales bacterium]|nr:rhomboid family intramembrane serine protease [Desulfobacterales bacterium]